MAPIPFTMTTGSDKELLVLKFGGTSVGTGARLVHVSNIIKGITDYQPIVVLSAMSGADKANGTTSRLLEASTEILKPQSQKFVQFM